MLGAFVAFFLLRYAGISYWLALLIAPLVVGFVGVIMERLFLQWLYKLDHLYGLLLTFGLALVIEGVFRNYFGSSGLPYGIPEALQGSYDLGFMFLPIYRGWVVVALADRLPCDLVRDRAHASSAPICAPRPRTRRWCAPSASMCRA